MTPHFYGHLLFHDDEDQAQAALEYIRETFDKSAELCPLEDEEQTSMLVFDTDEEFSEEEAQALIERLSPSDYDFNNKEEEEDEESGDFPEVWSSHERDQATLHIDDDLALEYIRRLERVACAAYVFYAKSCNLPDALPSGIDGISVEDLAEALYQELASVDFMK